MSEDKVIYEADSNKSAVNDARQQNYEALVVAREQMKRFLKLAEAKMFSDSTNSSFTALKAEPLLSLQHSAIQTASTLVVVTNHLDNWLSHYWRCLNLDSESDAKEEGVGEVEIELHSIQLGEGVVLGEGVGVSNILRMIADAMDGLQDGD